MEDKKLRELLEQVQREIDHASNVDEKGKLLLRKTKADIEAMLARQENEATRPEAESTSRLEETIAHFEATHPDLALTLTELLNILSNAGI